MRQRLAFALSTLTMMPLYASAEATLTATVVHADFSHAPEVRLLVRVLDEAFGTGEESIISPCAVARDPAQGQAPDSCFGVTINEGEAAINPTSQTLLAKPERASDPIYLELTYRTHYTPAFDNVYSRPTAAIRVETNGFYNWNADTQQALPQNVIASDSGVSSLVLGDADALLNATFRDRVRQLPKEDQEALRNAQRQWITLRDAECTPKGTRDRSVFGEYSYSCLVRMTLDRARQLAVVSAGEG